MKDILIRKASVSDLKVIQELNGELCVKESREYDSTIDPKYPFTKVGEEYFKSRIESEDSIALIAEVQGEIVGYLVGALIEPEDYRTAMTIAEAENMFVKESARGQGIGSELNQAFEEWCKKEKVQRIRYVASAANTKAIEFYKVRGAKEVSITLENEL